jgi:hypothetical protein
MIKSIESKQEAKQALLKGLTETATDVETLRKRAKIAAWGTASRLLLELTLEGKVNAVQTTNGYYFYKKETA